MFLINVVLSAQLSMLSLLKYFVYNKPITSVRDKEHKQIFVVKTVQQVTQLQFNFIADLDLHPQTLQPDKTIQDESHGNSPSLHLLPPRTLHV